MLKVKKTRLFTWIQRPWSFLIKENGLAIECHDQLKDLFEWTTFCSFEKGKNDFSQNWQEHYIAKKGFYTTKFWKENSAHFKNFSWISSFWNHHADLIKGLYHHHGWPLVSSKNTWTTSGLDPPKRGM